VLGRRKFGRIFILGKSSEETLYFASKQNYQKNIEKGLIFSLVVFILFFRFFPNKHLKYIAQRIKDIRLEAVTIREIPDEIPVIPEDLPTTPRLQAQDIVVQQISEPENADDQQSHQSSVDEEASEFSLDLPVNKIDKYLVSNSQVISPAKTEFELHVNLDYDKNTLFIKSDHDVHDNAGSADLMIHSKSKRRKAANDKVNLNLGNSSNAFPENLTTKATDKNLNLSLNINNGSERILRFAASSIDTDDYKLWNKINAELDRLNKGRYGKVPDAIRRHSRGFYINFNYSDGVAHQIHWQKDGNVWIKISGKNSRSSIFELRRALKALLGLAAKLKEKSG